MEKRMEKTDYKITEFHNSEFGSIRMIEDGGRLLFSGMDVAFALGYAKPRNAINVHCKGALKRGVLTSGGVQPMIFIPEGDVYRLITKSRLKSAQNFEKWVFDEVLPAIRKTGGYLETDLLDRVKDNPELLLEFAERLLAENNRNRELQNRVKDMQPKADYYDHFMITGECTNIRTTAKEIEFPERKFVKLLLNRGFLYRSPSGTLLPYAVEKNNDLFIVKDYFNAAKKKELEAAEKRIAELSAIFKRLYDKENAAREAAGQTTKPTTGSVFDVKSDYTGIQFDSWSKEFILSVKHESVSKVHLGADALGNITRINNLLESYPEKLAEAEQRLETVQEQLTNAKEEVGKPFTKEEELNQKLERLSELNALLNMDEREDTEAEQSESKEKEERPARGSIHEKLQIYKEKSQRESENGREDRKRDFGLE